MHLQKLTYIYILFVGLRISLWSVVGVNIMLQR